jgi:hypothetical protein
MAMTNRLARRARKKVDVDATRIGQLLRLALSTGHDGEALAAIAALKRSLASADIDLHDVAVAVETGLRTAPAPTAPAAPAGRWGAPAPSRDDWQSMAWFCHHHRYDLRSEDREFIEECLLGTAFRETDDQVMSWHLERLRRLVSVVQGAGISPW